MSDEPVVKDIKPEENDPNTFSVAVADTVGLKDLGPGGTNPDEAARQKELQMKYLEKYVEFNHRPARWVEEADVKTVLEDGVILANLCRIPRGVYRDIPIIVHSTISNNPLRFALSYKGEFIINPIIVSHTSHPVERMEGCVTHPGEPKIPVKRFNKIVMHYQTIVNLGKDGKSTGGPQLSEPLSTDYSGPAAQVLQSATTLLNGHTIYDKDFDPLWAVGV